MVVGGGEVLCHERLPGIDETHLINELMAKGAEFGGKGTFTWLATSCILVIGGGFYVPWQHAGQQMMTFGKNGAQP